MGLGGSGRVEWGLGHLDLDQLDQICPELGSSVNQPRLRSEIRVNSVL